ncbi:10309_t:CDS:10 [Ambispora gerdemannii]|uniref:10309_t:CDS:1 n=1 Tax=Ambispora gerdemannii TaxID=144530 RepID=A0A9N8V575_9GLOM|nr:10309_t:CDS:10 [Ambispora gerdemannii]
MNRDIRIVVAVDFGTTFSTFAYANIQNPDDIVTNDSWPEQSGSFKTNTALQYNDKFQVVKWGYPALAQEPSGRKKKRLPDGSENKPVELFKLCLASNLKPEEKPTLPAGIDHKKAITDYLREMGKLIIETLSSRWPGIRFPQQVRVILTVPAEWHDEAKAFMRLCAFDAGLTDSLRSENLEFTTEPEAAAIHCISILKEHQLNVGSSFMIVDCGGGTVDLTTRTLLPGNKLGEVTERAGGLCGSSFVDREFVRYVGRKVGMGAMNKLQNNNYGQLQYMIQQFCIKAKFPFNGNPEEFISKDFDIERVCPALMKYVTGVAEEQMEEAEWLIELDYASVKAMFDPVVDQILQLIQKQITSAEGRVRCMFLVGGFAESQYLQLRVKQAFSRFVTTIAVPSHPIAAIVRGALSYGLNMGTVETRVLKWTYGVEVSSKWERGDPVERKTPSGRIFRFHQLAQRGVEVGVDQTFKYTAGPVIATQMDMTFNIYVTSAISARYCDEDGMRLLGKMKIDLPDPRLGKNRLVEFSLTFATMEIKATARNVQNGGVYQTTFDLEF